MVKFYVFHDNNSVFTDHSEDALDFARNEFTLDLVAAEDYLYLGYYKPFSQFHVELNTVNSVTNTFTKEFYDGTTWTTIDSTFMDDSRGLTRSGFITFDRDQTDWVKTTINSQEAFWIRLRPSSDHDVGTKIQGIGMLFSGQQSLINEYADIESFLDTGQTSFIMKQVAARQDIIQMLRNAGRRVRTSASNWIDVTEWDLLKPEQFKQAGTYLALSKIFFDASDDVEDKWYQLYKDYKKLGKEAVDLVWISLDADDDGVEDGSENLAVSATEIVRL